MPESMKSFLLLMAVICSLAAPPPAAAQAGPAGRLASAAWLKDNLARADMLVLDASPASLHKRGHIPGSVNADLFAFSPKEVPLPQMEARPGYWLGVVYLGLFASALAFPLYFAVMRAVGPGKAAYSSLLVPILAMAISTVAEGYRWTSLAVAGGILAMIGLFIALRSGRVAPPAPAD